MKNQLIPYSFAKRHGIVFDSKENEKILYYKEETKSSAILEVFRILGQNSIALKKVDTDFFENILTQTYNTSNQTSLQMSDEIQEELDLDLIAEQLPTPQDLLEMQDEAPIIKLMNGVLTQAVKLKASDIHLETYELNLCVRFRLDGVLHEILSLPRTVAPLLVSRIKVMAKLDIAEKRLPQDGRISLRIAGHTIDTRVSTLPSNHGERVVLRLLDKKVARLNLKHLGLDHENLTQMEAVIANPNGIILVTGPTGAGKTTTLYAILNRLNQSTRNILTVEDPIEYDLPGIGQTQVNTKIEMTFARGLRAILRQDPDIVMVGEIRDKETTEIAVQASLTGHLVLSTLHTNSAVGAITRLRDMGVESYLLASSLIGVIAQRLIRVLCQDCKESHSISPSEKELLIAELGNSANELIEIFRPKGCVSCQNTGYSGRTALYEIILITKELANMIHEDRSEHEIEKLAHQHFRSIRHDGFIKVKSGISSLEEVLRVMS